MTLIVSEEQLNLAREFAGLLKDELLDLVNIYNVGNPRADGINYKINGLQDALDKIGIEKKKPEPIPKIEKPVTPEPEPKPVKTLSYKKKKLY